MRTIPLEALDAGGSNAPLNDVSSVLDGRLSPGLAARIQSPLRRGAMLDALLVSKSSDILVVSLHGATDRDKTVLPRFERLRSISEYGVSGLYFSDPALHLNHRLQLGWFTGWSGEDVQWRIALLSAQAAALVGARKVIFTGASGGGFAALQASALLPGSIALAFNAQTDISNYRVNGESWGAQRHYVQVVWPEVSATLSPPHYVESGEWAKRVDDRVSAVRRFSVPRPNLVYLFQNEEEFHYQDHFLPFLSAATAAGNTVIATTNREGILHNPPRAETWRLAFEEVIQLGGS